MEFKRMNQKSKIEFFQLDEITTGILKEMEESVKILQINFFDNIAIVEYLEMEEAANFNNDIEKENALDTIINTDPFGAKYSGRRIREIFENNDREWLDKALKFLHNQFIKDKLQLIIDRGGHGKIIY